MNKELDELLNSLLKEIPERPKHLPTPPEPPVPTEEAFRQAEKIAQDVEQDKSWQIPPEQPRPEKPAPQHDPVVVPPPVSHFTDTPSPNPAIRMHDRLDETSLPKPDVERKPTQIMETKPRVTPKKRKKRKPSGTTAEAEPPKRKIPHIVIPDELPPDIPREQAADDPRQAEVRSRAEQIREQLRRRSEETADEPVTPEQKPEQPTEAPDLRIITENTESNELLTSIKQQVDKAFSEEKAKNPPPEAPQPSGLRHLSVPEDVPQTAKPSFFGRFRQKKDAAAEPEQSDDAPTDWRTLVDKPGGGAVREILNSPDEPVTDTPEDDLCPELKTPPMSPPPMPPQPEQAEELSELEPPPMPDPETPPMPPQTFAEVLREAFDETAEELAEMKAEPLPERGEAVKTHFLKRYSYFLAGIVCFVFAVIGLITCIRWGTEKVQRFAGSASLRQTLEDVLYPVAVVDLPAFDAPGELDAGSLLSAAMVHILMYDDLSGYPENFDVISIPASDVLARAQTMFGTDFTPEFDTLHAAGEAFFYDSASGCYNVPSSPAIFSYSPEVTEIRRSGDTCTVTVRYRSDLAKWQERSENFRDDNAKTMQITLIKSGDSYQITKIANVQTGNGE